MDPPIGGCSYGEPRGNGYPGLTNDHNSTATLVRDDGVCRHAVVVASSTLWGTRSAPQLWPEEQLLVALGLNSVLINWIPTGREQ